jgi:Putative peptidoglycan binding domain
MKQFIKIMFAGLLGLAALAQAQQDDSPPPTRKKERQEKRTQAEPAETGTKKEVRRPLPGAPGGRIVYPTPAAPASGLRYPVPSRPAAQSDRPGAQKIRARHAGFHAQPKPQQIPPVDFDENRRIKNSEHWPGDKYADFRFYRPHRHDRDWYHKHCRHIVLSCGGYYYWYNFYWYPAWGYDPFYSYYVYDGPIYAAIVAEVPDQIITDVQAALQDLGYYDDGVDGILGEMTREAITAYQADNGLYQTGAIDQPTLESLGLG